jgi:hypothetical protein
VDRYTISWPLAGEGGVLGVDLADELAEAHAVAATRSRGTHAYIIGPHGPVATYVDGEQAVARDLRAGDAVSFVNLSLARPGDVVAPPKFRPTQEA